MPKEEPVEPFDRGDVEVQYIDVGADKKDVIFYSLQSGEIVAKAKPTDWDVYVTDEGLRINYHRFMKYAQSNKEWSEISDTVGLNLTSGQNKEDQYLLKFDSIYVVDMGKDLKGVHLGFIKIVCAQTLQGIDIQFSALNGSTNEHIVSTEGVYIKLEDKSEVDLPNDNEYDISFGKYMHFFEVEQLDYEVFGVITPKLEVIETAVDFSAIDINALDTLEWTSNSFDEIGYDWKYYSLDKSAYAIDEEKNYIIKTRAGFIYKLRFVNYYDEIGSSGYPTFEYKLL